MNKYIGLGGLWMIFWGAPMLIIAIICCHGPSLERIVGTNASPYVLWGIALFFAVINLLLLERLPRKFVIYVGITGWVVTAIFLIWFCDFGPGSFGHVSDDWVTSHKGIFSK